MGLVELPLDIARDATSRRDRDPVVPRPRADRLRVAAGRWRTGRGPGRPAAVARALTLGAGTGRSGGGGQFGEGLLEEIGVVTRIGQHLAVGDDGKDELAGVTADA